MNPRHIKYIARVISVVMMLALLAGLTPDAVKPVHAAPGDITRVSVDSSGAQANAGSSRSQISADGRYVAFVSDATNLIPDDTNNADDVFVKDRQTGATTRVSVTSQTGAQSNGGSETVAISSDGRYVTFYSDASNLISGDTNGVGDIFVHDRQTGLTIRASVDSSGTEANDESSNYYLAISGDGRYVAFPSKATNLVSGDTNGVNDIFVHDCQTGQTRRISVASDGTEANGSSFAVNISDDGHYVTFSSSATNLVAGDTNGTRDVFVYDLQIGGTTLVSVNTDGEQADGGSNEPDISGDGRYVVFVSSSNNLSPEGDYYGGEMVYVRDRQTGQTTLASVHSDGFILVPGMVDRPTISRDGRYVAFSFYDKGDNNGILHVWVRDLQTGTSVMAESSNGSGHSSLSADGKFVAFSSSSSMVSDDTNGVSDVFVREVAYGPDRNPVVVSITPKCGKIHNFCPHPTPSSVSFIVIFSEQVTGVGMDDFSLDMLDGITGASITGVSGYGLQYYVTVNTGTGDGKLRLNIVDNDSIQDTTFNPLGGAGTGNGDFAGHSYWIEKNPPVVMSIVRVDPSPTAAAEVRFTVTFSEVVYPVELSDFVLSTTGSISGAAVTDVSPWEDGQQHKVRSIYIVTVNTGSGDGTLRLDLVDDDSIRDGIDNPLGGAGAGNGDFITGETYTINKSMPPSPPIVIGILRAEANPTGAANVNFNVTFSEAVSGVDSGDFSLATTGNISGALVTNISGSENTYTVTVDTGSGNGDLRLDVVDDDSIVNTSGSSLGGLGAENGNFTTGEVYTINKDPIPGDTLALISISSTGIQANNISFGDSISNDGRFVVFSSAANNLVTGDTNGDDIFVHDRQTGETMLVSVATGGEHANYPSSNPKISGDGRYVVFESQASNLIPNDSNHHASDIFVHDRQTGETSIISVATGGEQANDQSYNSSITADGRFVTFESSATNLVSDDTNGKSDVFLHDRQTGETIRISVSSSGVQADDFSYMADISADGRYVAFESSATNLISGDTNDAMDIFVLDRQNGEIARASVTSNGIQADDGSYVPGISGNGRYVVFESDATNLVSGDKYGMNHIYVHDLQTGETTRASVNSDGSQMIGRLVSPTISDDGRFVAFAYADTDNYGPALFESYIHDRQTGTTTHIPANLGNDIDCPYRCSGPAGPVVEFRVIFSEIVTGVDASDFALSTGGGISGATITNVRGTENEYIVTVDTGSGDGTLRLDVLDNDTIMDPSQNPLGGTGVGNGNFTSGEVYTVHKSLPTVTSIVRADPNPTTSENVNFLVTFSEDVNGVDTSDFELAITTGNISGATVTNVIGFGKNYSVQVNTGTGNGTLRLDLVDNDNIWDIAHHPLSGIGIGNGNFALGESYTINKNGSMVINSLPKDANPTNADSARFTVTFPESVGSVDASDFVIAVTGSITNATVVEVNGTGNTYTVNVNTGTGDGTLRLGISASAIVADITGNPLVSLPIMTGESYTIDKTEPAVASSARASLNDPTNLPSVDFTVTFSEPVTGVEASDFVSGAAVSGGPVVYTVSINTDMGDGDLRLQLYEGTTITDLVGNSLTAGGLVSIGEVYRIDKTAPVLSSFLRASPSPTNAASVDFTVTFSESVSGVDAGDFVLTKTGTISGESVGGVSGGPTVYTVTVNTGTGDGTFRLDLIDNDSIVDLASNPLGGAGSGNGNFTSGDSYIIDKAAPVVISILRTDPNPTTASSVHFNVTFSKAVSNVDADDFVLTRTGNLSVYISDITSSGNIYTITVTSASGTGSGTLRLDLIDNDSIMDSAIQPLGGLGAGNGSFTTSEVYTITIAPTIISTSYRSTGFNDGWVLESDENSNAGGSKNSNANFFRLGDDVRDRQFRAVLHFPTYYLPDNAVITQAILMIKKQDVTGTNPFTTHQNISIDIRKGLFSNFSPSSLGSLQLTDFQAAADMYAVGTIQNNPVSGWYWALLDSKAYPYINLTDITQLRLAFQLDDNDDKGDDYIRFYSGDYKSQKDRPHLLIEYYVPR